MTSNFHSHAQHGSRPPRTERVAEQLRQEISRMMLIDMKDPRVRMASISQVSVAPDMRSARVMVSAVGEERERHAVVSALRHAEGYLRGQLGERLENLKTAPKLRFELDESIAYSVRISSMLRELDTGDGSGAAVPEASARPDAELSE
ncbi:MAG: 30S ribosome-binding factor RbfA [Candidatus Dormibacteraeota bacterium]|uniref:Ribosome-binding factor A n=1 Tax=Candidatus Amunia macphersoniae TaxID=3127014 RepID=A0A934NFN2_9BACT|nr:30S ribosome-binding factor RbfA [Candidatus Dormibacteraeota bacterium]